MILKILLIDRLYFVKWYIDIMQHLIYGMTLIHYIYPRILTEVTVSATVGMSATVGEMSTTVGTLTMV